MTEDEARQLVLVRSFDTDADADADADADQGASSWTRADQHWADSEALRRVGENATPTQWLVARARLAIGRLADREPLLSPLLTTPRRYTGSLWAVLLLAAFAGAAASSLLTPPDRINLLAPPLLALMAWNLLVYAVLMLQAIGARARRQRTWRTGLISSMLERITARRTARAPEALQRFALAWTRASLPLQQMRVTALLHLGALALAAGALLALYLRGLVFEFGAGWDSTFLSADEVRRWLAIVLAPALALTGQTLPPAEQLEQLRFSRGGAGPAANWIHLYALTATVVMLPRALLALAALVERMRLRRHFPLPLDDGRFERRLQWLAQARGMPGSRVELLPYGCRVDGAQREVLTTLLAHEFGPGVTVELRPTIAGGSDDAYASLDARGNADVWRVAVFSLSATPERETHGEFLRQLVSRQARPAASCHALIDESGYRARLAPADRERRLEERRGAWRKLLAELGAGEPWFIDLSGTGARIA